MYEVVPRQTDGGVIRYTAKNCYNQLLTFEIRPFGFWKYRWYAVFWITTKRNQGYQEGLQTGKDGVKSLIWAKACLLNWIESAKKLKCRTSQYRLYIWSDDARRFKVYQRYLIPLGFKVEQVASHPLVLRL